MSKLKVVMVLSHDLIHPHIDTRVYKEAKSLIRNSINVTVICRTSESEIPVLEDHEGIKVVRVYCPHPPLDTSRVIRLFHNLKNSRRVSKKIVDLKPDIVHCHDLNTLLEGAIARRKLRVPLIYDAHEDWTLIEFTNNPKYLSLGATLYEKILLGSVSHIIVACPGQASLVKFPNCTVLFNSPSKDFMKGADIKSVQTKYEMENKIVTVYHGGINEERGIIELIEAAEKLIKKFDNLKFLIIGGNYEPFETMVKEKKLEDVFIFTGAVPYSDIPSYLGASDISYAVFRPLKLFTITIATKVYEAMIAGLPVIANAEFPAQKKLMTEHRFGLLVNCNASEIRTSLEKLINDASLRNKLGKVGKKLAEKEYNWEAQERKLFDLYNALIKR